MNILLNAVGVSMGGAVRHLHNFLLNLIKIDSQNNYHLFLRKSYANDVKYNGIIINYVKNTNHLDRLWFDNIQINNYVKNNDIDLVVSLSNFGPIRSQKPHVVLQGNSLYFCDYYLSNINPIEKLKILSQRRLLYEIMKQSALILTPSISMEKMIKIKYPQLNAKQFKVLYHGYSSASFKQLVKPDILNGDHVKLLYPTHLSSYRGFEILIKALGIYKKISPRFVLYTTIARSDWPSGYDNILKLISTEKLNDNIKILNTVPQDEIGQYYQNCDLMIYPSLCESFGFPMIEAIGHGLPIVAADTPINREICGDAALYYPALKPADCAAAIARALDKSNYRILKNNTIKVLNSFDWSWNRYVIDFLEILNLYDQK